MNSALKGDPLFVFDMCNDLHGSKNAKVSFFSSFLSMWLIPAQKSVFACPTFLYLPPPRVLVCDSRDIYLRLVELLKMKNDWQSLWKTASCL